MLKESSVYHMVKVSSIEKKSTTLTVYDVKIIERLPGCTWNKPVLLYLKNPYHQTMEPKIHLVCFALDNPKASRQDQDIFPLPDCDKSSQ